jgi:hypothetical protein
MPLVVEPLSGMATNRLAFLLLYQAKPRGLFLNPFPHPPFNLFPTIISQVSVGTLLAFSVVSTSVLILRYVPPEPPLPTSAYVTPEPSVHKADLVAAITAQNPQNPPNPAEVPGPPISALLHHRSLSEERLVAHDPLLGALRNLETLAGGDPPVTSTFSRLGSGAELRLGGGSKGGWNLTVQ